MDEIEIFLRLAFAGLGLILAGLSAVSWFRTRENKVMLAAAGFTVLAMEGVLLAAGAFSADIESMNTMASVIGLNFLAMLFLYLSILKR